LPVLRPDLEFHRGPDDEDGAPTYTLHDPVRGTFEKLTWVQAEILRRLRRPITLTALQAQLTCQTTIDVSEPDVLRLCADATARGLTRTARVTDWHAWNARRRGAYGSGPAGLFRRCVFLRIPLIHPDAFLERTVGTVRHLAGRVALACYALVGLVGLVLLSQRLEAYVATFPYFFNWQGAAAFAIAIAAVKTVHEFAHAYVAKALGNRVPTMGVALIFLFPVAFADVTDSWRMHSRRQRLLIALAGVLAELVIAGVALFVWSLSPPGIVRSVCFVLSSVTLLSTLLVNLNPAMRFDGYYVLSDLLGIDNLQSRAFAATRWILHRHVLGMAEPCPEPNGPPRRLAVLALYALGAWAYRLLLYTGIALMLYHRLTKIIGGLLLGIALYTFLIRPLVSEIMFILRKHRQLAWRPAGALALATCGGALLWAAWPLPRWYAAPASTRPRDSQTVYVPSDGVVRQLPVGLGARVETGQTLLTLHSPQLDARAELAALEVQRIALELGLFERHERKRTLLPPKLEELSRARAHRDSVQAAIQAGTVTAEIDGRIATWDESVRAGTPVGARQVIGEVVADGSPDVVCYVPAHLVGHVQPGQRAIFESNSGPGRWEGSVRFVNAARARAIEHRGLGSVLGGDIPVVAGTDGRLEPVGSWYEVEVALHTGAPPPRLRQTGRVWLLSDGRSYVGELLAYGYRMLVRESSF
jgi:putative peptide zinc metalloprotease protein